MHTFASSIVRSLLSEEDSEADEFLSDFSNTWTIDLKPRADGEFDIIIAKGGRVAATFREDKESYSTDRAKAAAPANHKVLADYLNWLDQRFPYDWRMRLNEWRTAARYAGFYDTYKRSVNPAYHFSS